MKNASLFSQSNELWATKRKKLSMAFYKDKLIKMLNSISNLTINKVQIWKDKFADKEIDFNFI